jgi:hypothetical protein
MVNEVTMARTTNCYFQMMAISPKSVATRLSPVTRSEAYGHLNASETVGVKQNNFPILEVIQMKAGVPLRRMVKFSPRPFRLQSRGRKSALPAEAFELGLRASIRASISFDVASQSAAPDIPESEGQTLMGLVVCPIGLSEVSFIDYHAKSS